MGLPRLFMFLALVSSGCLFGSPSQAIEIGNFRSGLVCPYNSDNNNKRQTSGWICFETEAVYITGQSRCTFDGNERPCTWYGFEFDYSKLAGDEEITCKSKYSEIGNIGNPDGVLAEDTNTFEYSFKLRSDASHFYNPQYSLFSSSAKHEKIITDETVCSVDSQELFRFKFQLMFPKSTIDTKAD
jgi:hypothetical protein